MTRNFEDPGDGITVATQGVIEERLRPRIHAELSDGEVDSIIQRGRGRPLLDQRPDDGIVGFGPDGLPG